MTNYAYRRKLTSRELIPALGAGAGVALAVGATVAYLAQILLRRTELGPAGGDEASPRSLDRSPPDRR